MISSNRRHLMNDIKIYILLLILILVPSCTEHIEDELHIVEKCSDAPVELTSAGYFTFDGKGYVFGGRMKDGIYNKNIYCYDPQIDQWQDLGPTPFKERVRPRAIVIEEDVYLGLGFNGRLLIDSAYLRDWWKWNPATDTWTRLPDYPSDRTVGAIVAGNGKYIYAAYGGKQNFERWIFRYDTESEQWIKLNDGLSRMSSYPPRAHSATGCFCDGRFYFGSGYFSGDGGSLNFWAEAEYIGDSVVWHKRKKLPSKRHNAVSVSDNQYIYICGGHYYGGTVTNGILYNDILCYNPNDDSWRRIGYLPDEIENAVCWYINGVLYLVFGNDKDNNPYKQMYCIRL